MEEENHNEDEYGRCPNCGSTPVHVSEMGRENGTVCCKYCYQDVRNLTNQQND